MGGGEEEEDGACEATCAAFWGWELETGGGDTEEGGWVFFLLYFLGMLKLKLLLLLGWIKLQGVARRARENLR